MLHSKLQRSQVDTIGNLLAESVPIIQKRKLQSLLNTTRLKDQENVNINLITIFGFLDVPIC